MSKRKLVIVGDSAFAQIAREYFDHDSDHDVVAFAVEQAYLKRDSLDGLPVVALETLAQQFDPHTHSAHVAVTYQQLNRLRSRLASIVKSEGYRLASYVSSRAFVWRNATLGEHCFVFEDNTVQPFVRVGRNVVLWSGNHIGHHSVVGDNCFVSSHVVVSGFCTIGENSFLGVNSTIANNVTIGRDNWLGPATTITQDTAAGALYRGEQPEPSRVSALRFFRIPA
jgi:sugar O-acyltransferase (sialic acid O-acetyltransferase NeuD family)